MSSMAKFSASSQEDSQVQISYESWSQVLQAIFKDTFIDQLHAVNNGDLKREVTEIYRYFQGNKESDVTFLQDVDDVKCLAEKLGWSFAEVELIEDQKRQLYLLAKSYVNRAHSSISNHTNEPHGTSVQLRRLCRSSRAGMSTTVKGFPKTRGEECQPLTVAGFNRARAFSIRSNSDFKNFNRFSSPRHAFYKTETFKEVKAKIFERNNFILHLYGMSGSGKSQIAMSICKELDANYPDYLVWHIQSHENGSVLIREWQAFTRKLQRCLSSDISKEVNTDICTDLQDQHLRSFVKMLNAIEFKILLVVEDIAEATEKVMVRNLISELSSSDTENVHLVVVTQKLESVYSLTEISEIKNYVAIRVSGFKEKEAIDFLGATLQNGPAAIRLAEELAYSPLRLFLAKTFCDKFNISYEQYYNSLGEDEDVIRKEKEILKCHPDLGKHTYEVIMKILTPANQESEDEAVEFEVIKMMSFLDSCNIPDILLRAFLKDCRDFKSIEDEHRHIKYFLHKLGEECDIIIRSPLGESKIFAWQVITIHNDILSAVRLSMDMHEKKRIVTKVLQCIISLVGKENRLRTDSAFLFDMMSHMRLVADFAAQLIEGDFNPNEPKPEDFDIQMCLSRLYEVLGFTMTQAFGKTKDENFGKAIDYLWCIACYYTGNSILKAVFGKRKSSDKLHTALHYQTGKNPSETSKKVYKRLCEASVKIPIQSITKSCTRFFPITLKFLGDMKVKLDGVSIAFEDMEKDLKQKRQLTEKHIEALRRNGAMLTLKKLRNVYLTECIASILHSRGRQVLYLKESVSIEEQRRYEWYTDLGLELCRCLSKDTGVKIVFEYIIQANNKLPRMLHPRQNETDAQFWLRIENSRKVATELMEVDGDFYEHGVYKLISGTPYTVMNALKYKVKANTKLYKRPQVAERHAIPTAITECEQLYQMAKENSSEFVVASNCMIHAGKYYAAVKEFEKALQAFEHGFGFKCSGINSTLEQNVNGYAWALYNFGRTLCECGGNISDFDERVNKFLKRYDTLPIPDRWRKDLYEVKKKIETMS